ncbi:MAG: hypothetical protein EAZ58_04460, partial [Flavobacterium sp.]
MTASQLAGASVSSGAAITQIGYNKTTTGRPSGSNSWTLRVYLKNVSNTSLATGTSWDGLISGATLAYTATINSTNMPNTTGYWMWPTTGFTYTGGGILCCIEWFPAGTMATPFTSAAFGWEYTSVSSAQAMGTSSSTSIAGTNSSWSTQNYSYNTRLVYTPPPPCSGTPSPGNTISSSAAVAPGSTVNLSLQNATTGTGVSYQWQSSTTSATTGFSNITGANSSTYTATVNAATWYRCIVTCSGNSGTSTATQVTLTYCTPSSSSVDGTGITNVTFGVGPVVNNTTAAETNNYGDYSSQIGAVYIGNTVTISMTFNTSTYAYTTGIYVDWNQDLDFNDAGETVWTGISGTSSPNTLNATFTLPGSAVAGQNYRMRIGGDDSGVVPAACATGLTYACFEDYTLSVITCTPPTTQASAITFGSITSTSSNVNWTNGNGGGRVVYINTTNSFTAPSNGTNPTATTAWANTGQQCVFNGTGSGPVTVTGLSASTTYWVRVYEYCTPNRNYQTATATGNSNSFTTAAPTPTISASSVAAFGNYCINGTTTPNSFTVSAAYLSPANASLTISSPVGFGISTSSTGPFSSNLTLTASSGSVSSTLIYVVFQPTAIQSYSGNISITGGGATAQNIPVSGSGVSSLTYTGATNTISAANSSICLGSSATLTSSVSSPGVVTMNSSSSLSSSSSYPTAFENYWYQSWQQFLYTASELQALGLTAGNITSLSFNVNTVPNPNTTITDYNIKVGSTTNGSISTFTTGGLTNVFGPTAITAASGWNTITFATPYNWDGVSNIIIDLRQTGYYGSGNAVTVCNTTASSSVVYAYSGSNNATFWSSGPVATATTLRPNIKFGGQVNAGPTAYSWSNGS